MFETLKLGSRVEMVFKNRLKGDDSTTEYVSQILDFSDDGIICAMPIYEGHIVPLQERKRFEGYFYSDNKIYSASCIVKARGKQDNLHVVEIGLESKLIKVQRREYFRLSCSIPATIRCMTVMNEGKDDFKDSDFSKEEIECTIIDISGGGIRAYSKQMFEKSSVVLLNFTLKFNNGNKEKSIIGKVVDSFKNANDESVFDNRFQFIDVSKSDRDEIVKYIFEQQRNILKKELGYNG